MKKIICLILMFSSIVISSLVFGNDKDYNIVIINGILNNNPNLSPTLDLRFFDDKGECGIRTMGKAPANQDFPISSFYSCGKISHIVVTPKSVITEVWQSLEQKINYGSAGGTIVLLQAKDMPVFNPDGTVKTPGIIQASLTPYRGK